MKSNQLKELEELIATAKAALSLRNSPDIDFFLTEIGYYLDQLQAWQGRVEATKPFENIASSEKETLRGLMSQLQEAHEQLLTIAGGTKEEVGKQLQEVTHRASGLRKYVNTLPARITITGKRQG